MRNQLFRKISTTGLLFSVSLLFQPSALSQTPTVDSEQWAMLTLVNNFRAQNGVPPLQLSVALQNASQWMSVDRAAYNYFGYRDSLRRTPGSRLPAFGYNNNWGEDIAEGVQDAQSLFNQWLTTPLVSESGDGKIAALSSGYVNYRKAIISC